MTGLDKIFQGTVFVSAVLYIVAGVPLLLCWVSVFIVIALVLAAVIIGNLTSLKSKYLLFKHMFTVYTMLLLSDYQLHGGVRTVAEAECADPGPKLPAVWLALASGDETARPLLISQAQEESQNQQSRIGAFNMSGFVCCMYMALQFKHFSWYG